MIQENTHINNDLYQSLSTLVALLDRNEYDLSDVASIQIQKVLEHFIKLYVAKAQNEFDEDHNRAILSPLLAQHSMTQTEAVIFVDQFLKNTGIEIFEVQMWRSMG